MRVVETKIKLHGLLKKNYTGVNGKNNIKGVN
jgi:hypothetical protein